MGGSYRTFVMKASFWIGWGWLFWGDISVIWVMADIGSAFTAGHFGKEPQSNQRALAPPLGTSLMLGVPSLRLESVGRRDGPSLAQRG